MTTVDIARPPEREVGRWWWMFLITGILWIIIGLVVLEADAQSAALIGYLLGFWLLFGGITELMELGIAENWKWLHGVLGVLFIIGGIAALMSPFQTFTILADLVAIFLVLKGTFDFIVAIFERHIYDLWWLMLICGILEVLLGFWAAGYPGRSAALLLIWVGFGALIRGVVSIVVAFRVRKLQHEAVGV